MKCFQLCFPVLISCSLSLITLALLFFSSRWQRDCAGVWWCVTWVRSVQQGQDEWGEKPPAHVERAEPCHRIHNHHRWHPPEEQIQLLSCHFISLCCSTAGLNGEHSPGGHTGHATTRQVGPSLPSPPSSSQALMALQVALHSQGFSNPHAWLQISPSKGHWGQRSCIDRMSSPAPPGLQGRCSLLQGMSTSGPLRSRHGA